MAASEADWATSQSRTETGSTCALCGRKITAWRRRSLNGFGVCRRCWGGFVNRRQAAFLIDFVLFWMLLYLPTVLPAAVTIRGFRSGPSSEIIVVVTWLLTLFFAFKDGFSGYSPGKYLMGVRVVDMATRTPIGFWQSFKRNIHLSIPAFRILAIVVIGFGSWPGRRWGDRWAETLVIWCKHARKPPFHPVSTVCVPCGYDLTGNVSGICPECGTPIPEATRGRIADVRRPIPSEHLPG